MKRAVKTSQFPLVSFYVLFRFTCYYNSPSCLSPFSFLFFWCLGFELSCSPCNIFVFECDCKFEVLPSPLFGFILEGIFFSV